MSRPTLRVVTACVAVLALVLLAVGQGGGYLPGVFPYVLLLACPLMHLLHGGHGGRSHASTPPPRRDDGRRP